MKTRTGVANDVGVCVGRLFVLCGMFLLVHCVRYLWCFWSCG